MGNVALIMLERRNPQKHIRGNNLWIVIINGFLLAFTFIAYAAFDPVLIGMFYNIIAAITVCALLFTSKRKFTTQPFTLYCVIGYVVSAVVTVALKLHH
jgi:Flp pilus assembly protein TadB